MATAKWVTGGICVAITVATLSTGVAYAMIVGTEDQKDINRKYAAASSEVRRYARAVAAVPFWSRILTLCSLPALLLAAITAGLCATSGMVASDIFCFTSLIFTVGYICMAMTGRITHSYFSFHILQNQEWDYRDENDIPLERRAGYSGDVD